MEIAEHVSTEKAHEPGTEPEQTAPLYWELHTQRDHVERIFAAA